jgi:hypothetical protein
MTQVKAVLTMTVNETTTDSFISKSVNLSCFVYVFYILHISYDQVTFS